MTDITYRNLRITGIREEAPGVKTFFLEAEDGLPVAYQAGQFLTFVFNQYGREERRSYSVSSSPDTGEPLAVTIKRIDNGRYSRLLLDKAQTGDLLPFAGAAGLFILPQSLTACSRILLFAAGIGITPLLSVLKSLLVAYDAIPVVLIYSNRAKSETVFYDELMRLQALHPQLQIEWLFSNDFHADRARLSKALMPLLLRKHAPDDLKQTLCYVCGPYPYMWLVALLMEEAGMPAENLRRELFVNDQAPLSTLPPDTDTHMVTVYQKDQVFSFPVQYPDTILQGARRAGHVLPYSCEAGRCSSCAARCTSGQVWMTYNEVLTGKELAAGLVLTCTGHPVGGDVVIIYA